MPLKNETWQQVPGTEKSWIYPFMRKPDVTCSNVYLIRNGEYLFLIDTGACPDLMKEVLRVMKPYINEKRDSVFILFSHLHIDHMFEGMVNEELFSACRPVFVVHESGVRILQEADREMTVADVFDMSFPPKKPDIALFPSEHDPFSSRRTIPGILPHEIQITQECRTTPDGLEFFMEYMDIPGADRVEFWYTPGHTDDSFSVRIGDLLHLGDIPFATNPGVAGVAGWDPEKLKYSIEKLLWLIGSEEISTCISGHGIDLERKTAEKFLKRVLHDLNSMPKIALFNRQRRDIALWHAIDLLEEIHHLFPVIAGRILFLTYQLEELGEEKEAERIASLFPESEIDESISEFDQFYQGFLAGDKLGVQVVLKALQILNKITRSFPDAMLKTIIDPSLLRRNTRLFEDFLSTIQGTVPQGDIRETDLEEIIHSIITSRNTLEISDEELMERSCDEELFREALISRISTIPHQGNMEIVICSDKKIPQVKTDQERLSDLISAIFDMGEASEVQKLEIVISADDEGVMLEFTPGKEENNIELCISRAMHREINYCGGEADYSYSGKNEILRIFFPFHHLTAPDPCT